MAGFEHDQTETAEPTDALIGRVLGGRYEIRRLIGVGGMGRVYEGRQRALDRPVAIKCIHPHFLSSEPMLVRFMEEARVASQLVHANIVKIYDFGHVVEPDTTTFFLVMELLTGPDLASVIRDEGPLPIPRIFSILRQVLSALGEAHARGITHRDAKPDNVILESRAGRSELVKVIDFGIAKVHGARGVTTVGQFVGTPHFMSPEQIRGQNAEVTADLYSVGITLFQMLTGELPFNGDTVTKVLEQQLHARRPDPREIHPRADCSDELAAVCLRAMHAEESERFATADAFAEALEIAVADAIPAPSLRSSPYPPPRSTARPVTRTLTEFGPERTISAPPTPETHVDIRVAEQIDVAADLFTAEKRFEAAEAELRRGLTVGERWVEAGELELGKAALMVFGRKLGAVLRELGRLEESEDTILRALSHAEPDESARGRILAELVTTLGDRGRVAEAENYRLEALRIGSAHGDRELVVRLRRLAQSLALSLASRGENRASDPRNDPPPRRSDWRMRTESAEPNIEESLRRRR